MTKSEYNANLELFLTSMEINPLEKANKASRKALDKHAKKMAKKQARWVIKLLG